MIVAVPFALLAAVALIGAGGILMCRHTARCGLFFLVCCLALAGLYGLLNMHYIAVVQSITSVCMAGLLLTLCTSEHIARARIPTVLSCAAITLVFLTLTAEALLRGTLGESVLRAPPIWAVPGEHISTLGRELLERYTILLVLLALLLLAGILSAAYMFRRASRARTKGRKE